MSEDFNEVPECFKEYISCYKILLPNKNFSQKELKTRTSFPPPYEIILDSTVKYGIILIWGYI